MASKQLLIVPGVIYQVCLHGVFEFEIFRSPETNSYFREQLSLALKQFSYSCYGWSLMKNHYHLVLRSSVVPISSFMNKLNSTFSRRYNRVNDTSGYVFSTRYAGVIVQETPFLKSLVRYVHLNPVRNGLCSKEDLDKYEWSGHQALAKGDGGGIIDVQGLLRNFDGPDPLASYNSFMSASPERADDELIGFVRSANQLRQNFSKPESWVIGDPAFTSMVLQMDPTVRVARHLRENVSLERIHGCVASLMNIRTEDILRKGHHDAASVAREVFALAATARFDYTTKRLASYLGSSSAAVLKMIKQGDAFCQGNSFLETVCQRVLEEKPIESERPPGISRSEDE